MLNGMRHVSPCVGCGEVFASNPNTVPSIKVRRGSEGQWIVDDEHGTRELICKWCVERANRLRPALGFAPIVVAPAADEPTEEW